MVLDYIFLIGTIDLIKYIKIKQTHLATFQSKLHMKLKRVISKLKDLRL